MIGDTDDEMTKRPPSVSGASSRTCCWYTAFHLPGSQPSSDERTEIGSMLSDNMSKTVSTSPSAPSAGRERFSQARSDAESRASTTTVRARSTRSLQVAASFGLDAVGVQAPRNPTTRTKSPSIAAWCSLLRPLYPDNAHEPEANGPPIAALIGVIVSRGFWI